MKKFYWFRFFVLIVMCLSVSIALAKDQKKKIKIERVTFQGNVTYSRERLLRVFISRPSSFLNQSTYRESIFKDDLDALIRYYQQNGFLDMKISDWHTELNRDENTISIKIQIKEGERYQLEDVSFLGNRVYTDNQLLAMTSLKRQRPFKKSDVDNGNMKMLQQYANTGYLDAGIKPTIRIHPEAYRVLVDFEINENNQIFVGDQKINGNERTKDKTILRELQFKKGDVANYSQIVKSQRKIYLTGLFDRVFLHLEPAASDSSMRNIIIDVKEHPAGEFSTSLGFGSEDKIRSKMELFHHNIQGRARKASLMLHASFIRMGGEIAFTDPWFLGVPLQSDANIMTEYLKEPGYELYRIGGKLTFGRKMGERNRVMLSYQRNETTLENVKIEEIPDKLKNNQNSLSLRYIYDSRDNLFNPTQGFYWECYQEFGGNFTAQLNRFYRTLMRIKKFTPFWERIHIGTALEFGWLTSASGLEEVPLQERFYTGGPKSIRGFKYQHAGPLDSKHVPEGGMVKCIWNVFELRRPVYKMIGAVLFLDAGNVWESVDAMKKSHLRYSPGFGLRVHTVLGLARLDFGFNPDRRAYEPGMRVYFSMGQAF